MLVVVLAAAVARALVQEEVHLRAAVVLDLL